MTTVEPKGYHATQQPQNSYGPHWLPLAGSSEFIFIIGCTQEAKRPKTYGQPKGHQ